MRSARLGDALQQQPRRELAHLVLGLGDGGQRRAAIGGQRNVVEADHRQVLRHS